MKRKRKNHPRLFLFDKGMTALLLLSFLLLQLFGAAYYFQKVNALEEKIEEYRFYQASLQEEKHYLQQYIFDYQEKIKELEEKLGRLPGEGKPPTEKDRVAYLTFDDGPGENTLKLLEILREHEVKATFFVNGEDTPYGRDVYRRMVDEGHVLGNHTYSHNYHEIYRDVESFMKDYMKLEKLVYQATATRPEIMRFPGGSNNTVSISVSGRDIMKDITEKILEEGYSYFDWNVYGFDGTRPTPSPSGISDAVLNKARLIEDRAIILLHDNDYNTSTIKALPQIIEGLREQGYRFDTLDRGTPPHRFR